MCMEILYLSVHLKEKRNDMSGVLVISVILGHRHARAGLALFLYSQSLCSSKLIVSRPQLHT